MKRGEVIQLGLLVETGLYDAFVKPFVNVAKVAKLTAKRMANPLFTFVALLNPFGDEDWVRDRMRGFSSRRDALANDWKQLKKEIDDGLGDDARLVLFFASPAGYLASATASKVRETATDVALDATGLGRYIADKVGAPWESLDSWADSFENRFAGGGLEPAALAGIEKRLSRLFFKESFDPSRNFLREQEEQVAPTDQISTENLTDRLELELSVLGADAKLNRLFKDWYQETESLVTDIETRVGQKRNLAAQFAKIDSIEALKDFTQKALQEDLIDKETAEKIAASVSKQIKELTSDQEFVDQAKKIGDGDPQKVAAKTVLASALEELKPQMSGIVEGVDEMVAEIADSIPTMQQLRSVPANENTERLKELRTRLKKISAIVE